jgi:hypothetical protein
MLWVLPLTQRRHKIKILKMVLWRHTMFLPWPNHRSSDRSLIWRHLHYLRLVDTWTVVKKKLLFFVSVWFEFDLSFDLNFFVKF